MYFRVPVASGQTLEVIFDPNTAKLNSNGTVNQRGLQRTHPDESATSLKTDATNHKGRYMFSVVGTMRIIGGLTNDPNYRFYLDGNGKSFSNGAFQGTTNDTVSAPMFYVYGGTLELKNVHLRDNISTFDNAAGSAIHVANGGKVRLENVVIENCKLTNTKVGTNGVTTQGGAIYITGSGTVSLKNCTIKNCSAGQGGAIAIKDGTTGVSGVNNNYVLQIESSEISNCTAVNAFSGATAAGYGPKGGGAIYIGANLGNKVAIKNTMIKSCTSSGNGGGIFLSSGTTLEMQGDYYEGLTGGNAAKAVITGCTSTFAEKEGAGLPAGGGGLYAESSSTLRLKNIVFEGCCAENGDGGGVFTKGATMDMIGCRIDNCYIRDTSPMSGHEYNKYNLNGTNYFAVSALKTGTGLRVQGGKANLVNTTILKNQENRTGTGNANINGLTMVARGAVYLSGGAVVNMIEVARTTYNVGMDARVTANKHGGGVYLYGNATFRMYGGSINLNTMVYRNPTYINTTDPDGNSGYSNGAGVSLHTGEGYSPVFELYGGAVEASQNQTQGKGGAIGTLAGGDVYIYGGVVGCGTGESVLDNTDAYKNKATLGSGIYMDSKGTNRLYIAGGLITNGSGDNGSVYIGEGARLEMEGGVISNNATVNGGGIYATSGSLVYVRGGSILNNTASARGGGIFAIGLTHFFLGGEDGGKPIINNNTSTTDGGGVYVENAGVLIYDAEIKSNSSKHGAGLYATPGSVTHELYVTIHNCDISNNVKGSGIWMTSERFTLNMYGGTISDNTLAPGGHTFGGAGICATNDVEVYISGSEATPIRISGNVNSLTPTDAQLADRNYDTALDGGGIACITRGSTNKYNATLTIEGKVTISNNKVPHGGSGSETAKLGKGCGGGVFIEEGGTVVIREKDGYKPTISGNEAYRGGGVYVDGACTYASDGKVATEHVSSLTVNGAVFENNVSTEHEFILATGDHSNPRGLAGGAICVFHKVTTSIKNSDFTGNRANMNTGTGGGAISAVALESITIESCTFENNFVGTSYNGTITGDGGAVFCRNVKVLNLTDCTIKNNKAQQGGGLYVISDDYYEYNVSANSDVNVTGCTIESNTDGGVFLQRNSNDTYPNNRNIDADIGTTTIKGNTLGNHGSHRFGGAGITCVNGIDLALNNGTVVEGNVNNVQRITVKPAEISNIEEIDTAANGGGVAMIRKNTTTNWCKVGTLTVNGGATIKDNVATYGDGGGIYVEDSTGTLIVQSSATESVTISGNTAGNEELKYTDDEEKNQDSLPGGNGGGIYAGLGSKVRIKGVAGKPVIIDGNHAIGGSVGFASSGHGGGGVLLHQNTDPDGGAIRLEYVDVLNNTSEKNSGDGAGVYCWQMSLEVTNCNFKNNRAPATSTSGAGTGKGGGLLFYQSVDYGTYTLDITDSLFENNNASAWGGGVHIVNKTKAAIKNTVFNGNQANQGGGIHVYSQKGGGTVDIENVYLGGNVALKDAGGGLFATGYTVNMKDCNVGWLPGADGKIASGNTAGYGGGGMYIWGAILELEGDIDVSNNVVTAGSGGGIAFRVHTVGGALDGVPTAALPLSIPAFNGVVITNNTASGSGGGVYVSNLYTMVHNSNNDTIYNDNVNGKALIFKGCTVTGNTAGNNGGGVYAKDVAIMVNNVKNGTPTAGASSWSDNTAGSDGGAIYVAKTPEYSITADSNGDICMVKLSGTQLVGNSAGGNGGAIYLNGTPGYMVNDLIYNNEAGGNGGGICYVGDSVTADYSVLQLAIVAVGNHRDIHGNSIATEKRGNSADGYGGGMYITDCNSFVAVRGGYNYNSALGGGGIYVNNCENALLTGDSSEFTFTDAGVDAGNGTISISANTTYRPDEPENLAIDGNGAGMYADSNVTITNVIMQYNTAAFDGGGLCVGKTYTVTMNGVNDLNHNTSHHYGGGIIILAGGTLNIEGDAAGVNKTLIKRNKLTGDFGGAGIHVASGASLTMSYGEIIENGRNDTVTDRALGNVGKGYGGGIDITGGSVTLNNVNVIDNAAGFSGGGIRLARGTLDATNCVIMGNLANAGNGGGLYVNYSDSTATVNGCYVIGNVANGTTEGDTTMVGNELVSGVGGGVAVFDGGVFKQQNGGAIYDNTASVGAADVFANGLSATKLTILAPDDMNTAGATLNGVDIPAFVRAEGTEGKWWEDYKTGDTSYTEGLKGDAPPAIRYAESPVSIRAYTSSSEGTQVQGGSYINTDGEFVSIIFEVQKYNVGTITITAPDDEGVENQRFIFEVKGDPNKGDDFTLSVSLLGGESVTITNLYPGTYTITQKSDWSWRFDYENVTVTAVEGVAGTDKGNGVVEITIAGTSRNEAHTAEYDNDKNSSKWLSHNSEGKINTARSTGAVAFDMAEAKKTYVA